jgi:hypothetical protein
VKPNNTPIENTNAPKANFPRLNLPMPKRAGTNNNDVNRIPNIGWSVARKNTAAPESALLL